MVVACDGGQLDTGVDEEVDECGLHLCLAGLEVVAADEGVVLTSKFDGARDEGVLWGPIDERGVLEDTGDCEDG